MNANEFLHKKDVAYMNRLSTSLDFNKIVSLMEEYAALRQQPVGSSFSSESDHICVMYLDKQRTCMVCGKQNCC